MRRSVVLGAAIAVAAVTLATTALGDAPPWRARRRGGGLRPSERAGSLVEIAEWPAEPVSPDTASIDLTRFASALHTMCGFMPPDRPRQYAEWIVGASRDSGIDPFLLAGLVFRMSRCSPTDDELGGVGLTLLPREMYAGDLQHGVYRYRMRDAAGAWATREMPLDRFPFAGPRLLHAEENLYFAAHLLGVWKVQHEDVDAAFGSAPHRSYVSHWIWGDRIPSARAEDRVLTDRRRMLHYYGAIPDVAPIERLGVTMGEPLDGGPRVISSFLGSERDEGARAHKGVDLEAAMGEPVRAIADGRVNFSGCDLPGTQHAVDLPPERIEEIPRAQLGPGGRFVCVVHHSTEAPLTSCYMHLETTLVRAGDVVTRGQQIGTVGRTGCHVSQPHLHLELRGEHGVQNGAIVMHGLLLGREPPEERVARERARHRRIHDAWVALREVGGTP